MKHNNKGQAQAIPWRVWAFFNTRNKPNKQKLISLYWKSTTRQTTCNRSMANYIAKPCNEAFDGCISATSTMWISAVIDMVFSASPSAR
jgi:hypothetical protein